MIIYDKKNQILRLETANATYAMKIVRERYVAHVYYGKKRKSVNGLYKEEGVSFAPYAESQDVNFSLDTVLTELSFFGTGDLRDTAIKIKNGNGDSNTFFAFVGFKILKKLPKIKGMPCSRGGDETLELTYRDEVSGCTLYSYYTVYENSDTITRRIKLVNDGKKSLLIQTLFPCQLDIAGGEYDFVSLGGSYFYERHKHASALRLGRQSVYSQRGHSSHQHNPFAALAKKGATENKGSVYGATFVYSGDFEIQAEKRDDGRVRLLVGHNRNTFGWNLSKGKAFESPEVILTYSANGLNGMTQNMHRHIREQIIPRKFVDRERPILINTWEAVHFNINEDVIHEYAQKAKELGLSLLVMDDGWFGKRTGAFRGLGDWFVNEDRFPQGLEKLADRVRGEGVQFGIWIEPEMVNADSDLYRAHPDWVLQSKDRERSIGRKQLVLDLTNNAAVDYVAEQIIQTLKPVQPAYVKWDFNRSLTEVGSLSLPAKKQCEAAHRFVLGSYRLHEKLTKAFPDTLFEGCSGGGGRFDAGILYYCPQIWTSDNTDPVCRLDIQYGTSLAYPLSTLGSHVSSRKFNALETAPDYEFRFCVTLGGVTGYELEITKFTPEEDELVKAQVAKARALQPLLLTGDLYRCDGLYKGEYASAVVAADKGEVLFTYASVGAKRHTRVRVDGVLDGATYVDENGRKYTGEELKTQGVVTDATDAGKYAYAYKSLKRI